MVNQPPPLSGYNLFSADAALVEGLEWNGADWANERVDELGRLAGTEEATYPFWSPDSRFLAFFSQSKLKNEIKLSSRTPS